jgi:hypothetical protein
MWMTLRGHVAKLGSLINKYNILIGEREGKVYFEDIRTDQKY